MGIYQNGKKIEGMYIGGKKVGGIYLGGKKIFSSFLSTGAVLWNDPHIFTGTQTVKYNSTKIPTTNGNKITLSKSIKKAKNGIVINFSNFVIVNNNTGSSDSASANFTDSSGDPIAVNPPKSIKIAKADLLKGTVKVLAASAVRPYYNGSNVMATANDLYLSLSNDNLLYVTSSSINSNSASICEGTANSQDVYIYPVFNSITVY